MKKTILAVLVTVVCFSFVYTSLAGNKSADQSENKLLVAARDYIFDSSAKPENAEIFRLIKTADGKDIEELTQNLGLLQVAAETTYDMLVGYARRQAEGLSLEKRIEIEMLVYGIHDALLRRVHQIETALNERFKTLSKERK